MRLLRSQHKLNSNRRIQTIVLLKLDIVRTLASIEDLQTNLAAVLILARELDNRSHAFHNLAPDDGLLRKTRRKK